MGLVGFWFVKIILTKKLKEISIIATKIQNRDISHSIKLNSNDEIGEIVNGLNASIVNIRVLFEEILKVFSVSETVLSNASNDNSAIERINYCIKGVVESTQIMAEQSQIIEHAVNKGASISECTANEHLNESVLIVTNSFNEVKGVFSQLRQNLKLLYKRVTQYKI